MVRAAHHMLMVSGILNASGSRASAASCPAVVLPLHLQIDKVAPKEPEQGRQREQRYQGNTGPTSLGGIARIAPYGYQDGNINADSNDANHSNPRAVFMSGHR